MDVNVPSDYFSLAGFEVTMYGRFWVLCRVADYAESRENDSMMVFKSNGR